MFTKVELEFRHVVWKDNEITSEHVLDALHRSGRELSEGSVRKVLSIIFEKERLTRRWKGRSFIYKAAVPKDNTNQKTIREMLKRAFGSSPSLMVAALLESRSGKKCDLDKLRNLIADYEKDSGK